MEFLTLDPPSDPDPRVRFSSLDPDPRNLKFETRTRVLDFLDPAHPLCFQTKYSSIKI